MKKICFIGCLWLVTAGAGLFTSCSSPYSLPSSPLGPTATYTPTPTATFSPALTGSATSTPTPTFTGSPTTTFTFTGSPTPTWTLTGSPTSTRTFTGSPTSTRTFTPSPTLTGSPGTTPTWTPTLTGSFTPTLTGSPTSTWTLTGSPTWTSTATATAASCSTTVTLGDATAGAGTVSPYGQTQAQQYVLAQASTVQKITIQLASAATIKVGIYNNGVSSYPGNLLYVSATQTLVAGLNMITVPNLYLSAGTYWLAYEGMGGVPVTLQAAAGSTALRAAVWLDFPCHWLACGYASCVAPTCPAGPGTPTCTPTPVCTPPPSGVANNQGVIYAGVCY